MANVKRRFKNVLGTKLDNLKLLPGIIGDDAGNVTDGSGRIYVRVGGKVQSVRSSNVSPVYDLPVWVGYEPTDPHVYKILNRRVAGGVNTTITYVNSPAQHANTHEWFGAGSGGGSDVIKVQLGQFMPLRVMPYSGMTVIVWPDVVKIPSGYALIGDTNSYNQQVPAQIDLSAYASAITLDKSQFILITIDTSGDIILTEGDEVDTTDLALSDIPEAPADTVYTLAAVRIFYGQEAVQVNRVTTDIVDLRFPMPHTHADSEHDAVKIDGIDVDLTGITDGQALVYDETEDKIIAGAGGDGGITEIPVQFFEEDVSNPPTEIQLINALGSPDADAARVVHILNDNGSDSNVYMAIAVYGHWWLTSLSQAVLASQSVSVTSQSTIASEDGQWFGRAAVKVVGGIVVMCYYEATHHWANDGALHIRFSDDYGTTWSDEDKTLAGASVTGFPMNPEISAGEDAGEPWLVVTPNGKLLLHMWRVNYSESSGGTYQSVSTDGGFTWSTPELIDFSGISNDDKIFMTDEDFIYNNIIYAGARVYDDEAGTNSKSILVKSEDNGITWEYISDISDFSTYPTEEVGLEYIGKNTIYALLRDDNNAKTYKRISTDMGETWGTMIDITSTFKASGRHRVYTRSHLKGFDNWWNDKVLLCVGFQLMTPGDSFPRRNAVWISIDQGESWDGPNYIDIQAEDGGYGDMFYDVNNNRYVVLINFGTNTECDLIQYNLTIGGI